MESNIKSLTITGTAAEDATRSRLKGRASRKLKTVIKDEEDFIESVKNFSTKPVASHGASHMVAKPIASHMVSPVAQPIVKPVVQPIQPVKSIQITQHVASPVASHMVSPIENKQTVILNPPKQQRVKLQPKVHAPAATALNTTRRARRIHLNTGNLAQRFTRAKKVKDETEKKPIVNIREYLLQKGVIQQKSKAPEKILRSMYADFMLLNDHAL
jgi:hypothetical protein